MKKQFDVIGMGELLIDFTDSGMSEQGNPVYEANPGGAPCNVLAMLQKMGRKTAFIGKVGADVFGKDLRIVLNEQGIDTSHLYVDPVIPTTLAFVHTGEGGERDFSFYRRPGADLMIDEREIFPDFIKQGRIFHFGSLSMTDSICRKATYKAVAAAQNAGLLLSFDPNYRAPLWSSEEEAREQIAYGLSNCDILKISDNELLMMTGQPDYERAVEALYMQYRVPMIFLTMGRDGSLVYYKKRIIYQKAFRCDAVETTGAGDTFWGMILHFLLDFDIEKVTDEQWKNALLYANAAAGLITMRKGALRVMPDIDAIKKFVSLF